MSWNFSEVSDARENGDNYLEIPSTFLLPSPALFRFYSLCPLQTPHRTESWCLLNSLPYTPCIDELGSSEEPWLGLSRDLLC